LHPPFRKVLSTKTKVVHIVGSTQCLGRRTAKTPGCIPLAPHSDWPPSTQARCRTTCRVWWTKFWPWHAHQCDPQTEPLRPGLSTSHRWQI